MPFTQFTSPICCCLANQKYLCYSCKQSDKRFGVNSSKARNFSLRGSGMKHRRSIAKILFFLGITLVLVGGFVFYQPRVASAHDSSTCIQYGAFTRSVAFIEAQARGYFAQEGLNVCYNQVSSSIQQFNSLLSGQYDIISTTADNVVN